MIKILDCKNRNYKSKLSLFLEARRFGKVINTNIVPKIINDIKRNKSRALLKYEKKFSKNHEIKISKKKNIKAIKTLDPKIKKAIDFSYNRIYHLDRGYEKIEKKLRNIGAKIKRIS